MLPFQNKEGGKTIWLVENNVIRKNRPADGLIDRPTNTSFSRVALMCLMYLPADSAEPSNPTDDRILSFASVYSMDRVLVTLKARF